MRFRYKFLIVGIVVAAVGVAAVFSYLVQTARFESTAGAVLPSANGEGGLGLSLRGYQELATSRAVIERMRQKLDLAPVPTLVRNRLQASTDEEGYISITVSGKAGEETFQVSTDGDERFISITASGESGEEAFQLATQWIEAYEEQVQAVIQRQFTALKDEATERIDLLLPELALVEDSLIRFNGSDPVSSSDGEETQGLQEEDSKGPSETLGGGGSAEMKGNPATGFAL